MKENLRSILDKVREKSAPSEVKSNLKEEEFALPKRKYYDLWGHAAHEFLAIKLSLVVMAGITIISFVFSVSTVKDLNEKLQERPVIAVPGAESPGTFTPGKLPPVIVWDLGKRFALQLLNFNASRGQKGETASSALSEARNYLSNNAKERLDEGLDKIVKDAIENRETVQFIPVLSGRKIVKIGNKNSREVVLRGFLKKYIAGKENYNGLVDVHVWLNHVASTDLNPYGMEVEDYEIEEVTSE